nr:hypothetical protein [Tanacetum cinerariifolium]GEZ21292.1 hypothetical protein [Tanacetum cinerariifolium]
ESKLTLDSIDLECSMPIDLSLPYTDVLGDAIVDIDLLLGEHLNTLSMRDREINFNPIRDIEELERLLADDPVPVLGVFDKPLGEETRVMETHSLGFHHMTSPRPAAYSPKEVMYCYYHPHLTSGDGLDHGPKMK